MTSINYPLRVLHGFSISPKKLQSFIKTYLELDDPTVIAGIEEVTKARREVVPYGALVLSRLIKRISPSEIITSNFGVREGLLYQMLPEKERQRDPLIAACLDLAMLRSRSPEHALELCEWTAPLYPEESEDEERLRHAACLLSDVGWRTHNSFRGDQTMGVIAHQTLSGIDHDGRVFIALVSYFRHKGVGAEGFEVFFGPIACQEVVDRARILAGAIRTAHMISAGVTNIVPNTPISLVDQKLVLELPHPFDALDGERLMRRFEKLAGLLELEPDLQVSQDTRFFKPLQFLKFSTIKNLKT